MDTPDKAVGLSNSVLAEAVNKDWLLASAQSSQLSADLERYNIELSIESSVQLEGRDGTLYGTAPSDLSPIGFSRDRQHLATNTTGSSSAPPPSETSWLIRNQFRWPKKLHDSQIKSEYQEVDLTFQLHRDRSYVNNTYSINGHLYDNISYADSPLLRSLTRKETHEDRDNWRSFESEREKDQPKSDMRREFCFGKFRIFLACFVLLGITLANYSRNALSLAAVGMVASNAMNIELVNILANDQSIRSNVNITNKIHSALDGSCPVYTQTVEPNNMIALDAAMSNSPPLLDPVATTMRNYEEAMRKNELELQFKASIKKRIESGDLVDWSPSEQGLISAAGSVGNLIIAIPLTRLGEVYGPKWIIFVASLGAVIQAALMPIVSTANVVLVIIFQVVFNGLTYGADCVAYTLFAHWLTPTEMAFFVSCLIICYQVGTMISSFVTAKILAVGIAWSWCFYTPAILCGIWTIIWMLIGASEPLCSRLISKRELLFLIKHSKISQTLEKNRNNSSEATDKKVAVGSHPVSWSKLARDPNIWAIIAVKFTLRWYFSAYLSLMPTYLSSVGHMSVETIGKMSVVQSFIGLFSGILMGYSTKSLVTKRLFDMSLATTRKCFQSIVNFGLALTLIVFITYDCNQWVTISSLTIGGFCISFYVAAALQIPLDLSPTHCGLITSITNTLALGQALGAPISGLILNNGPKDRWRWRVVWGVAIVMNTLSGLIFILLVDSKPRDYNKYPTVSGESPSGGYTPLQGHNNSDARDRSQAQDKNHKRMSPGS